ncbi:lysozyme inhibitor LprI family protein [Aestuariicoccus sp. MJ-SS9]|uniref:lysozyme inhibitor LprI family protein n=1 Tax=Aestuariicoccus sp. MJ-SS9 TaxID=3079855 RepID=UPI00290789C9|nr:lysozyme inhibitor LprI family protein [Aestuariicoccus sp. MJ-SS9]MDU8910534.1 lysozyme inhibitor LprI family protein [Aestuariicoccus sp. MJ-SS9]
MTRLAALIMVLALPAMAQEMTFSFTATEECLASEGTFGECVGASADACMQSNAGGYTTVGMGYCLEQEWQAWDGLLNLHYGEVRAAARAVDAEMRELGSSAPSQADALRDMQRAWIAFRDAKCDYERSLWGGGTGGGPATLSCLMQETARQALYLEAQRN